MLHATLVNLDSQISQFLKCAIIFFSLVASSKQTTALYYVLTSGLLQLFDLQIFLHIQVHDQLNWKEII